jgi:hypothetical protein
VLYVVILNAVKDPRISSGVPHGIVLERNLHETMSIGPEEGQSFYEGIQAGKGLSTPPYEPLP